MIHIIIFLLILLPLLVSTAPFYPTAGSISRETNVHRVNNINPTDPLQMFQEASIDDHFGASRHTAPYHVAPYNNRWRGQHAQQALVSHHSMYSPIYHQPYYRAGYYTTQRQPYYYTYSHHDDDDSYDQYY